jgi:hypothetical protein
MSEIIEIGDIGQDHIEQDQPNSVGHPEMLDLGLF